MITEHLQHKLSLLPDKPGCYIMKDENGSILYVGKAKVLKNRVRSYFHGAHDMKTTRLVSHIRDFEFIVTDSEKEALLLEINLIKLHRPPYNIMFMDDKSYPYIEVTGTNPVAVRRTRRLTNKTSQYFGPYPNASSAFEIVRLINRIFPIRKCRTLPKQVCLYYHMHQCLGPCVQKIPDEEDAEIRRQIIRFLKGDAGDILQDLENRRDALSMELQFERAAQVQTQIESLQHVMEKQTIDFADRTHRDVFGWYEDKGYLSIYGLILREGKLLERTLSVAPVYGDSQEEFESFILQYYQNNIVPREILVPQGTDAAGLEEALSEEGGGRKTHVRIPLRGDKKKLADLAAENARTAHEQKFQLAYKKDQELAEANSGLSQIFGKPVHTVELFDNSHLQGSENVSGLVVFRDGSPDKTQYRHYKLDGYRSDLDSMKEVLYRRYFRLLQQDRPMPDLLLVDGGLQQVQAASAIKQDLGLDLTIGGLVKDDRHSTRGLLREDGTEVPLDRKEPLFFLLTRMQDEVHRFAISYHRQRRSKRMTRSILDEVPGIGPARKQELQKKFKSMKRMKSATLEELEEVLPHDVALRLKERLQQSSVQPGMPMGSAPEADDRNAEDAELAALAAQLAALDAARNPDSPEAEEAGSDEKESGREESRPDMVK